MIVPRVLGAERVPPGPVGVALRDRLVPRLMD